MHLLRISNQKAVPFVPSVESWRGKKLWGEVGGILPSLSARTPSGLAAALSLRQPIQGRRAPYLQKFRRPAQPNISHEARCKSIVSRHHCPRSSPVPSPLILLSPLAAEPHLALAPQNLCLPRRVPIEVKRPARKPGFHKNTRYLYFRLSREGSKRHFAREQFLGSLKVPEPRCAVSMRRRKLVASGFVPATMPHIICWRIVVLDVYNPGTREPCDDLRRRFLQDKIALSCISDAMPTLHEALSCARALV